MRNENIEAQGSAIEYLIDYKDGKIKQGRGIGCDLDNWMLYKASQMCICLGHDNVGKTAWIMWYYLCLVVRYKLQVCIWSGENQKGQIMRDLIQMLSGTPYRELSHQNIRRLYQWLENHFEFVNNKRLYKPEELIQIFGDTEAHICLVDPYTGLDREMSYEGNYRFLNETRQFVNQTGKTIYINTHPNTESGRSGMIFQDGDFKGHLKPPLRSHIEGGKSFLNRTDDMFTIHRMPGHKTMRYFTMIQVEKIKDKETGGQITPINEPVLCEYNYGLGFKINGVDPLENYRPDLRKSNLDKLF
tara:strand:+ start:210 stop:1112 length:903 start_codon:yes stop_codon:yes gene_type:complete